MIGRTFLGGLLALAMGVTAANAERLYFIGSCPDVSVLLVDGLRETSPGLFRAESALVWATPRVVDGKTVHAYRFVEEIDCAGKRRRMLQITDLDAKMNPTAVVQGSGQWSAAQAGTNGWQAMEAVCNAARDESRIRDLTLPGLAAWMQANPVARRCPAPPRG